MKKIAKIALGVSIVSAFLVPVGLEISIDATIIAIVACIVSLCTTLVMVDCMFD